jgi:hypothetical protein
MTSGRRADRLALAVAAVAVAAIVVTALDGTPDRLPGVALGSGVLLHAERAAALFAIVIAAVTVLAQAARGRLPSDVSTSGLRYEAAAADDAADAVGDLQRQLTHLEDSVAVLADRLDAVTGRP